MAQHFTVPEARALLAELLPTIDEFVTKRADLTEAAAERRDGGTTPPLADLKAMEANLAETLDDFRARGLEIKGWAPLLLDFPSTRDDRAVLLCFLEGERALDWYHDAELGFAARRPI